MTQRPQQKFFHRFSLMYLMKNERKLFLALQFVVLLERSVYRYVGRPRDDRAVRQRIKDIATTGCDMLLSAFRSCCAAKGWRDNHKRTYRLYKEEGLI